MAHPERLTRRKYWKCDLYSIGDMSLAYGAFQH